MGMILTNLPAQHYGVELHEPEKLWVKILAGKMLCDDLSILSIALERGLIELMGIFGRPGKPEAAGGKDL